ncbi:MAG TPA: serine/threonine-protein kinase [Casimicrobiaceae bacterium]|jgi:serine/threonine-protein kinase|nr:serine/threonine-protein kinase [Casimicrobiaceae bacterium]
MADISTLGKYEIRHEIGRGAMGVVYEGYDPMIKRIVALKTIRADQLVGADGPNVIARFRREAQAAGRLNHPNIVQIYEFGEDAGTWFIAMEKIDGRELKQCFETNERFTTTDIVRIMSQVLDALDYSHRQGVIHRDIKPANIFLLPGGVAKVGDFGIAHIETSNLTQVGAVMGTPSYMSPEQIMGLPVDGRSDLFSAGVVLYQFLTGERPFSGSATTTMQKVLKEDPLPPSSLNVQAPSGMDAVVSKALAKRPEDRFQTAREFADALRAAAPGVSVAATDRTLVGAADATVLTAPMPEATATRAAPTPAAVAVPTEKKSQTAAVAVAIGVAVVAVGAVAWYIAQRPSTGPTPATHAQSAPAPSQPTLAPAPVAAAPALATAPGTMLISAVGLIDPSDPRYRADKALLQADLRADSKSQLVEKALGLLLDSNSLARNYDVLKTRLLSQSASFVPAVIKEGEPQLGKDGLMSITTQGVVDVKAVQKSLNQMSRDERIDLIRASGNPKVALQVSVRDADAPDAPPQPSPVAENMLKERIKSFGFRTWSEGGAAGPGGSNADFLVQGEARVKKLSMQLPASGLTVSKYALTSWTVKCIDRETGEEIYYNTTLPRGVGSWASEEEALRAIGSKIADEFSRDFFLQHVSLSGQKVTLNVDGMPSTATEELLARELIGLPGVIAATPRPPSKPRGYDLQLAGEGPIGDLIAATVLKPLNAKLGQACFSVRGIAGDQVSIGFDPRCADAGVLSRLETNPPAGLYGAPPGRQRTVVKDPELLRKLTI